MGLGRGRELGGQIEHFILHKVDTIAFYQLRFRDIKTWHKAYLSSQRCSVTPGLASPCKTPAMPTVLPECSPNSGLVIKDPLDTATLTKHFSNREIDKGAWITNYINTSCAEHFPII